MIHDLLLITAIVCFGIDCTDFMDAVKRPLGRWLKVRPENITLKPFDCSLCSSWWCCLLWLLFTHQFTLEGVALSAACALLSKPLSAALNAIRYAGETAVHLIERLLDKIWKI